MQKHKLILFSFLFLMLGLAAGCETTKGVATGIGYTAEGVVKDTKGTWNGLQKADQWVKKNMW